MRMFALLYLVAIAACTHNHADGSATAEHEDVVARLIAAGPGTTTLIELAVEVVPVGQQVYSPDPPAVVYEVLSGGAASFESFGCPIQPEERDLCKEIVLANHLGIATAGDGIGTNCVEPHYCWFATRETNWPPYDPTANGFVFMYASPSARSAAHKWLRKSPFVPIAISFPTDRRTMRLQHLRSLPRATTE